MNSINLLFVNEETKASLSGTNISLELISDMFSNNYTTSNGSLYVDFLIPFLYAIRFSAPGYSEKFYYINVTNRSYTNLTMYLLSGGSNVTATVRDDNNRLVEDAYIKVLRYDLETNSYIIREIGKTNFEGEAILHLALNTEFYKFMIEYSFGQLRKTTSPTYIYETSLSFTIPIGTEVADDFFTIQDVVNSLTFNNVTNNFKFTYTDGEEKVSQGCLDIYQETIQSSTLYNSSCVSSATASIILGAANTTGSTYEAKAYVTIGGIKYYINSLFHTFEETSIAGNLGMLLIALLTIVFIFAGVWEKSVALILAPLPMLFGSIINIVDISVAVTLPLEIVCIIIAIIISRKD